MKKVGLVLSIVALITISCKNANNTSNSSSETSLPWDEQVVKMKSEIESIRKSGSKKCDKKSIEEEQQVYEEYTDTYTQEIEKCTYDNQYSIITAKLRGHEWYEDVVYYLKDNKVFFANASGGGDSYLYEHEITFDQNENIAQLNIKDGEASSEETVLTPNTDISEEEKQIISESIVATYNKVITMSK